MRAVLQPLCQNARHYIQLAMFQPLGCARIHSHPCCRGRWYENFNMPFHIRIHSEATPMPQIDPHSARPDAGNIRPVSLQYLCCKVMAESTDALVSLLGGRNALWHLDAEAAAFADPLAAAGIVMAQVDAPDVPQVGRLCVLPARADMPTDCLDLALVLSASADAPFAVIVLRNVPQGWDSLAKRDTAAAIIRVMLAQIEALLQPAALIAEPMLSLIERISDVEDRAASHLLMAILQLLAGRSLSGVQATALRIAGLADMPSTQPAAPDVTLNIDGQRLLAGLALASDPLASDVPQPNGNSDDTPPLVPVAALAPFARLHLMKQDFDVADAPASEDLWFRACGTADWRALRSRTSDGWNIITTEIIEQTTDILRAFTQMHLIRRRDIDTDEIAEIYDLHGVIWWLRMGDAGPQARLDQGEWVAYDVPADLTGKARAVEALLQISPTHAAQFADHARDWAGRMAHCVQVTPVMVQAAE